MIIFLTFSNILIIFMAFFYFDKLNTSLNILNNKIAFLEKELSSNSIKETSSTVVQSNYNNLNDSLNNFYYSILNNPTVVVTFVIILGVSYFWFFGGGNSYFFSRDPMLPLSKQVEGVSKVVSSSKDILNQSITQNSEFLARNVENSTDIILKKIDLSEKIIIEGFTSISSENTQILNKFNDLTQPVPENFEILNKFEELMQPILLIKESLDNLINKLAVNNYQNISTVAENIDMSSFIT